MAEGRASGVTSGTATILFTDLVGSTELRSRLGDAVADQLRRTHDQLLTTAVTEQSGTVVKSLGDGILAAFTATADAVTAGAAIQRALERANRGADDARRLAVRVGVSAGDVSWEDGDCHGTPVVTAARLCDRAEGGQILVDDLVRGLARGRSELSFRLVGELELKGLPEPVTVYEVPWEPAAGDRAPIPAVLLPVARELPFSGRDAEREALRVQWKSAATDGHSTALVSGEPGVGKTRLTAELARAAHHDGAWVLAGRCDESVSAPFAPWIEILRHCVTHAPAEVLAGHVERHGGEVTRLVPELKRRVDDVAEPRALDPETELLALFDAIVDLLDAVATDAPTLVVVDDAHWADASSLALLRHVVRRLPPGAPMLVVVTYRDTDVDRAHPLAALLGDFRREPRVERYSLRGIDESGVRALLTATGGNDLNEQGVEFAKALVRETEGNPFFLGEVLRHLVETGVLVQVDGVWEGTVGNVEEVGIPEGVRDVVGRRLSRLPEDANATLRTAAVVGREFPIGLVAEVVGASEDTVLAHVESAMAASLVDEVSDAPGRMTFSHALVRSTLLDELSTTRRVRLHRDIGEALERRGAASAAELAHHFSEAAATGVADRAVVHARRAAVEARTGLAYDESVRFYDLALEALESGDLDAATRAELLIDRGLARHMAGDPEGGRQDALAAAGLARGLGDARLVGRAGATYMGTIGQWAAPQDPIAVELMREGLDGLGADDLSTRASVTAALANALILVPGDEALELAEAAHGYAMEAGDEDAMFMGYTGWTWALRSRGRPQELVLVASEAVERSMTVPRPDWEWSMRYALGQGLVEAGELDAAAEEFARAGAITTVLTGWAPTVFAASRALAEGRLDDAEVGFGRAAELGSALGDTNEAIYTGQMVRLEIERGRFDEAMRWVERGEATLLGMMTCTRMQVLLESGQVDAAKGLHGEYTRDLRPLLPQVLVPWVLVVEGAYVAATRDAQAAARIRDEAARYAGCMLGGDTELIGFGDAVIGQIAYADARYDDAISAAERAIELNEPLGLHCLTAHHRVELARALLARDAPGDVDRARAVATEIVQTADALGLVHTANRARALPF